MEGTVLQLLLCPGHSYSELTRHHMDKRHNGALEQLASPSDQHADASLLPNRTGMLLTSAILDGDRAVWLAGDDDSSCHNNNINRGIVFDQLHENRVLDLSFARLCRHISRSRQVLQLHVEGQVFEVLCPASHWYVLRSIRRLVRSDQAVHLSSVSRI